MKPFQIEWRFKMLPIILYLGSILSTKIYFFYTNCNQSQLMHVYITLVYILCSGCSQLLCITLNYVVIFSNFNAPRERGTTDNFPQNIIPSTLLLPYSSFVIYFKCYSDSIGLRSEQFWDFPEVLRTKYLWGKFFLNKK